MAAPQQLPRAANNNNNNNNNWLQILRKNDIEVYVLFVNQTQRTIALYWIDPTNGISNFYMKLMPAQQLNVNTYRSHPWMFRDSKTGERMHVRHQLIYWPAPMQVINRSTQPERIINVRQQVNIHYPVRSLVSACLWTLADKLTRNCGGDVVGNSEESIEQLHMPFTLKEHLREVIKLKTSYRQSVEMSDMYRLLRLPR